MKMRFLVLLILSVAVVTKAQSWKLIWSDEFDGPSINTSNWTFETGNNNGWGNNELEYYTSRPENAKIVNGELVITALQESYGGKSYTSARIKTQGKKSFTYGRIEAYMKIPMGQGSWPAFWTLGENITSVGWPKCGEIDIMEHVNSLTVVNGTVHYAKTDGTYDSKGTTTSFDPSQYHLYAIEWDAGQIKWFIDSRLFFTFYIVNSINGTEEFHLPHFILLNLAIGGNWPKSPDGTMQFPITMNVDYVRVYGLVTDVEKTETIPNEFNLLQNYPNPFNPETTISYKVQAASQVSLKVFDLLGREVATLVDEYKQPGNYKTKFNVETRHGASLQSGVYYYQLRAGDFLATKKLTLLK